MLQKNFELQLDVMDQTPKHLGRLVKTDFGGNILNLRLTKSGKIFDLSEASSVTFTVRYNGSYLTAINGVIENVETGQVSLELPDVCVSYTGLYEMEVQVKDTGVQMTSAIFMYDVRGDLTDGADPSLDPEYPILIQLIDSVETLESAIETAEALRVTAENGRSTAEGLRVIAETGRDDAEIIRLASEITRISSEDDRNSAETIRLASEITRISSETDRNNAEITRLSSEITRVNAESDRVIAETNRDDAEIIRLSSEIERNDAEVIRLASEIARVSSETDRDDAEVIRLSSEITRVSSENDRKDAEVIRLDSENARSLFEAYVAGTTYVIGNKVSYLGSSYRCKLESLGNLPTNDVYWLLIAAKGIDGDGAGDMLISTYDPSSVSGDTFDMANMKETTTEKVLTAQERLNIANNVIDIIDEDNGKNYITQLKVVNGKPVLEYEEVL